MVGIQVGPWVTVEERQAGTVCWGLALSLFIHLRNGDNVCNRSMPPSDMFLLLLRGPDIGTSNNRSCS